MHSKVSSLFLLVLLLFHYGVAAVKQVSTDLPPVQVQRLNNGAPIIDRSTFVAAGLPVEASKDGKQIGGANINGPCLIRVPDWLKPEEKAHPTAVYYLYFASHSGHYIRMAWSAELTGPYTLYNTDPDAASMGVLDNRRPIEFINGNTIQPVDCASPDVVVDQEKQCLLLFFHVNRSTRLPKTVQGDGWFDTRGQATYVATSRTGLNFNGGPEVARSPGGLGETSPDGTEHGIRQQPLANAYLRTFSVRGRLYGLTNYGPIWQAPLGRPWDDAWVSERWPRETLTGGGNPIWINLLENFRKHGPSAERGYAGYDGSVAPPHQTQMIPHVGAPRHFAVRPLSNSDAIEVYYTARGEKPEAIYRTIMDVGAAEYQQWTTRTNGTPWVHDRVLWPEMAWEGASRPLSYSKNGAEYAAHALRDPYVFIDRDGKSYLLYSGGPEEALGIAEIIDK
jgi:hypothetical protein